MNGIKRDGSHIGKNGDGIPLSAALPSIFDRVSYSKYDSLPINEIVEASVWCEDEILEYEGNSLNEGCYRGTPVKLSSVTVTLDGNYSAEPSEAEVCFRGIFIILAVEHSPRSPIALSEAGGAFRFHSPAHSGDPEFDARFELLGDSVSVCEFFTPAMLSRFKSLPKTDSSDGALSVCFLPDGRVGIAISCRSASNDPEKISAPVLQKTIAILDILTDRKPIRKE